MLKPNVAEGKFGEAIGKLNDSLIERLNEQVKDAVILSIMILEGMEEIREQIVDFPGEWADLLLALNQLKLATDKATKVREEYIRRAEAATKEKERGSGVSEAIREFKRKIGWMSDEEAEEYIDIWAKKADRILNTPEGSRLALWGKQRLQAIRAEGKSA